MEEDLRIPLYSGKKNVKAKYTECKQCNTKFLIPIWVDRQDCCSKKCSGLYKRIRVKVICSFCSLEFERTPERMGNGAKTGLRFCSRLCKDSALTASLIDQKFDKLNGPKRKGPVKAYRKRAFIHYGPKCVKCGYDERKKMLDVDHIDSNRQNNAIDNLQVLCVWCHAEKTRANWPDE